MKKGMRKNTGKKIQKKVLTLEKFLDQESYRRAVEILGDGLEMERDRLASKLKVNLFFMLVVERQGMIGEWDPILPQFEAARNRAR